MHISILNQISNFVMNFDKFIYFIEPGNQCFRPNEILHAMIQVKIFSYFSLHTFSSKKISLKLMSLYQNHQKNNT